MGVPDMYIRGQLETLRGIASHFGVQEDKVEAFVNANVGVLANLAINRLGIPEPEVDIDEMADVGPPISFGGSDAKVLSDAAQSLGLKGLQVRDFIYSNEVLLTKLGNRTAA
jgi:hypothetical protein